MTGTYRLRDARNDARSSTLLLSVVAWACVLGLMPVVTAGWSLAAATAYVLVATVLLLAAMFAADRRLREVAA